MIQLRGVLSSCETDERIKFLFCSVFCKRLQDSLSFKSLILTIRKGSCLIKRGINLSESILLCELSSMHPVKLYAFLCDALPMGWN